MSPNNAANQIAEGKLFASLSCAVDDPFDQEYILNNYRNIGCMNIYRDVFALFADSAPRKIESIRNLIAESRLEQVIAIAHGLKGEAGSVAARHVHSLASSLEKSTRSGDHQTSVNILPDLEREVRRAIETGLFAFHDQQSEPDVISTKISSESP